MTQPMHTQQITNGKRTYFFDIQQTKKGSSYLKINLSQKNKAGAYDRKQIKIYENEMEKFTSGLMRSIINFQKTGAQKQLVETQKKYPNAGKKWTAEADQELELLFAEEKTITELSDHFKRSEKAIHARILKLRLEEKYIVVND